MNFKRIQFQSQVGGIKIHVEHGTASQHVDPGTKRRASTDFRQTSRKLGDIGGKDYRTTAGKLNDAGIAHQKASSTCIHLSPANYSRVKWYTTALFFFREAMIQNLKGIFEKVSGYFNASRT